MMILVHQRHACLKLMMPDSSAVAELKVLIQGLTNILPRNQRLFFKDTAVSVITTDM